MPNLLASLTAAAGTMKAFESAMAVVQNNVTNASTPGYARQQMDLVALAFQPELELSGGVQARSMVSSRDDYAERSVRQRAQGWGRLSQLASGLSQVEPVFDLADGSGIAGALSQLSSAFSQLGVTPNDLTARQNVIGAAQDVARSFNFTGQSLAQVSEHTDREIRSVVDSINRIAGDIRDLNAQLRGDYRTQSDAGVNARMYASLEELSTLVDFNAIHQPDGTVTVLIGGQVPLVIGDKTFAISADFSGARTDILDYSGKSVGGTLTEGQLGGLLELANDKIPSYIADVNRLAAGFADTVNGILAGGLDLNGQPPIVDLFQYDGQLGAAVTLGVTNITPDQIAAASAGTPGGNGNALDLAEMDGSKQIDGYTFTEFYGNIAARAGRDLSAAQEDESSQSLLLTQARTLHDDVSGVNLDQEAASLLEFQRGYEAAAQMIRILQSLTDEVFNMLR